MSSPNISYRMTPWWEHTTTTTEQPCDDQPVTTTTSTTPAPTTTSTELEQPTTTTSTVDTPTSTTVEEQPTTTVEVPTPEHRFELTPAGNPGPNGHPPTVEQPNPIHVAVSTPLPEVDAVVLAPPVSYAAPTLPHTGSETVTTAGIGGLLVAVGLICTALAARTRKAHR